MACLLWYMFYGKSNWGTEIEERLVIPYHVGETSLFGATKMTINVACLNGSLPIELKLLDATGTFNYSDINPFMHNVVKWPNKL